MQHLTPCVLITRPRAAAQAMIDALAAGGMQGVCVPTIGVMPVDDTSELDSTLRRLDGFDYAVFTSASAARIVAARWGALGLCAPARVRIVAGPATARTLAGLGVPAALIPSPFSAAAALAALRHDTGGVEGKRVFLPRGDRGRDELAEGLRAAGAVPEEVTVYRTEPVHEQPALVAALAPDAGDARADAIAFFSPSAVVGCAQALRHTGLSADAARAALGRVVVACIGETTASAVRQHGWRVDVVAEDTTTGALVAALAERLIGAVRTPSERARPDPLEVSQRYVGTITRWRGSPAAPLRPVRRRAQPAAPLRARPASGSTDHTPSEHIA